MPTYEYQCNACSLRFELKRHFDEKVEADCPQCSSQARRLFSPVPIVFKGPGFYVTDNAAENSNLKSSGKRDEDKPADKKKESEPAKEKKNESEPARDRKKESEPVKDKKSESEPAKEKRNEVTV